MSMLLNNAKKDDPPILQSYAKEGSVGGIWYLSVQVSDKVRGWVVERKWMFTFSSFLVRAS